MSIHDDEEELPQLRLIYPTLMRGRPERRIRKGDDNRGGDRDTQITQSGNWPKIGILPI